MTEHENPLSIDEILMQYLEELLEGGDSAQIRERYLAEYPEFESELAHRMDFIRSIFEVADSGRRFERKLDALLSKPEEEKRATPEFRQEQVTRIICPHCGNHLKLLTDQTEITCGSCGSIVTVDPEATRSAPSLRVPKEVGRFKIERLLGRGGFGTTYLAHDPKLNRAVAIKIPRSGEFLSASERERFIREAQSAAMLRHPNIVTVHEIGDDNDLPFIVCDYIEGVTLKDLISGRMLTHEESARLIAETSDAVHAAHEQRIIHRDLKPSNILLNLENKPFVADFGLARNLEAEITMTLDGEILGTPAYMSPEQASGRHNQLTFASDIYSLGVMLYRLLSSELPFRGSQRMMLHQVVYEDPKPLRQINEKIPIDLETITLKAMSKEPEGRYSSAQELADDLRRWLSDHPIRAKPASTYSKLIRWCRRNKKIAVLVGVISGLLVVISVISSLWAMREAVLVKIANRNAKQAVASDQESTRRLVKSHVQNGLRELENGVHANAIAWFSEALKTEIADPFIHRTRIGTVLDRHPRLRILMGSPHAVRKVSFDGDGDRFMTVSGQSVNVIDVESGDRLMPTLEHETIVLDALFSPNEQRIATLSAGKSANLWNGQTGELIASLQHSKPVKAINFDSLGTRIATAGQDKLVQVWNAVDGTLLTALEHPHEEFDTVKFLSDDLLLTSLKTEIGGPSEFRIWDIKQNKLTIKPFEVGSFVRLVMSDGNILVATADGNVQLWNAKTGKPIGKPIEHDGRVGNVFFPANSDLTTTVQYDGTISSWNRANGRKILIRHPVPIFDSAADAKNRILAVAGSDGYVSLYWLHSLQLVCAHVPIGNSVNSVEFHPQGRQIIAGSSDGITRIWDLCGLAPNLPLMQHNDKVNVAKWSPDDERVVSCSDDGSAQIWNSQNGKRIGPELKHEGAVADCAFNRDGELVATAGLDNKAQIWNGQSGTAIGDPLDHSGQVVKLRFSPTENLLVTGTAEGNVTGWVRDNDAPRFRVKHDANITDIKFSPDGTSFGTASVDESAIIWDPVDGSQKSLRLMHSDAINRINFSVAGNLFLTCGMDNTIRLWQSKQPFQSLGQLQFSDWPYSATFNSTGTKILTSNFSGSLSLWEDKTRVWEFHRPKYYLTHAVFDSNERFALTCGTSTLVDEASRQGKGAAFLVDAKTGQLVAPPFEQFGSINRAYFDNATKRILTASHDSTLRIWNLVQDQRSADEIGKYSTVLTGKQISDDYNLTSVPHDELVETYKRLRQKSPEYFAVTPAEIRRWDEYVDWVVNLDSFSNKETNE